MLMGRSTHADLATLLVFTKTFWRSAVLKPEINLKATETCVVLLNFYTLKFIVCPTAYKA